MKYSPRCLLAASCLFAASTAFATPAWETGSYDPATWIAATDNLIAGSQEGVNVVDGINHYTEGGKNMTQDVAALTDGVVPGSSMDYTKVVGVMGGTLTWELDRPANLTEFRIFSRWGDGGRDGIYTRSLAVRYAGETEFTVLDAVPRADVGRNDNNTSGHLYAFLTDSSGAIAENITGIQLTFSDSQDNNGSGYVEIEAIGVPAGTAWHTVSVGNISAWRATVSGAIGSCAGGTSSDVYFAYGTDASALVPALVAEDVAEEGTFSIPISGLTAGTTYSYASYSESDTGVRSALLTGTFTTPAAIPVEASATLKYAGTTKAALEGVISNLGEEGTSAAYYFAIGTDAATLVPTLYTNGLAAGTASEIPLTGLDTATSYAFAVYAINDLGAQSATYTGTFTTSDGTNLRWIGLVSENWSDGLNWDTEIAPATNATVAKIILDYPYGCHPPANLDIPGLSITRLRIASTRDYSYTMDGEPFTCWGVESEGSGYGDVTILNDIELRDGGWGNFSASLQSHQKLHLDGTLSSPVAGITVRNSEPGGSLYIGGENTFSGRVECHVGTLYLTSSSAVGTDPAEMPAKADIQENFGSIQLYNPGIRNLELFLFGPTRRINASLAPREGTETVVRSFLDENVEFNGNGTKAMPVKLDGNALTSANAAFSSQARINVAGNTLLSLGTNFTSDATRGFRTHNASMDFAGKSFPGFLENYSYGTLAGPNFINSDRSSETVLTGPIRLGYDYNTTFFGGPGDIRVEGDIGQDSGRHFYKSGAGRLTLAGETAGWTGSTSFAGDTTLDYSAHTTSKLGSTDVTMSYGDLHVKGNAGSAVACEMTKITLNGGLVTLSTETGAGLSLSLSKISGFDRSRVLDFQLDAGTSLAFTDTSFANNATLGTMNANVTWDHGRTFAYLNGDGTVGPMPASLLDATLEDGTIWGIGSGETSVASGTHKPVGIFIAATEGSATLTLGGTVDIQYTDGTACPVLVSSDCGGDVTITGGTLKPQNWNHGITVHNWNTNGVLRVSSNLPETNDNNFMICGPGTTILDNDGNGYYYGPHTFGGGTVRFTSIADSNSSSALGKGKGDNGQINIGHGCTFEYIGTAAEGHSSNRRIALYGDVTLKASGVGPLALTNTKAVTAGISGARAILDGESDGVLDGALDLGPFGSVVKRGAGTWTITSDTSSYEYPTEVEEGTLVLDGSLPSSVEVGENGTLALGSGAVIKRHLSSDGTLRFNVGDDPESFVPATVWGRAEINGAVALSKRLRAATEIPLLSAENGLTGTFAPESPHVKLVVRGSTLYAKSANAATILLLQ